MAGSKRAATVAGYAVALQKIVKTEGYTALWRGVYPTLLGVMPYAGIRYGLSARPPAA